MQKEIEMEFESTINSGQIPGVVLMAKDKSGTKLNYTRCYGTRTPRTGTEPTTTPTMTVDTPMRLASASKIITAVMAMQCVERGILCLDGDVADLLPEVGEMKVLDGFEKDSQPNLRDAECAVTLRHLLTHTSGISYVVEDPNLIRYRDLGLIAQPNAGRIAERFKYPLIHDPGRRWSYGPNLEWTGKLIERATGMTLEQYMQDNICAPLGVTDMTFKLQERPGMMARRADMSKRDEEGVPRIEEASYYQSDPEDCFGGMGIFASPAAFMAFLQSLLAKDGKLLSADTVEAMLRPQLDDECEQSLNDELDARQETNHGGLLPQVGIKRSHGLGGLLILEDCDGGDWRQKGSMGWGGFPNLYWCIDPAAGLCILIAFQLIPWADKKCVELGRLFERAMYEQLKDKM
ncbi:acyltransferase LovD [Colletotrichum spaethianum]|uniref:Acyltransferase LovD n=1 Tax=Colletotrichum spaethianum TaxID=700344 RepID=A0AA37PAQ5_9PEZI|nr:acyltransferase LovD [Colletotrichum spaethianum]GKT48778.1 acyltransferase LovD [Colletotrichum spaethianum]